MINKNLKWLRNSFGISLKDLSRIVDVNVSSLSSYEDRGITPKYKTLLALWKLYKPAFNKLSLDEMLEIDLSKIEREIQFDFFSDQKSSNGYYTFSENESTTLPSTKVEGSEIHKMLTIMHEMMDSNLEEKGLILKNLSEAIKRKASE